MARMGVFSRRDDTPEPIPRSLQLLSHRNTYDARYMEIYPNFAGILYPNESISVRVTNFVRSIPMIRPMFTRVRVYQSFVAVPLRIMWSAWEDYIKGENDADFLYEEPYIVNATCAAPDPNNSGAPFNGIGEMCGVVKVTSASGNIASAVKMAVDSSHQIDGAFRGVHLTKDSYVPDSLVACNFHYAYQSDDIRKAYMTVGVHELADYFNHPLYVPTGKHKDIANGINIEHPFSAFKFCAYQLAYSYFERNPNVQTRIDDFYQMSKSDCYDFPSVVALVNTSNELVPTDSYYTTSEAEANRLNRPRIIKTKSYTSGTTAPNAVETPRDVSLGTSRGDKLRTCWEFVEKFPLKSGANLSMLACQPNSVTGLPEYVPSNISLTRKRFANWQTDYFTSCNPWQQRGDEVQIPVNGSVAVNLDGVTFSLSSVSASLPEINLSSTPVNGSGKSDRVFLGGSVNVDGSYFEYSQVYSHEDSENPFDFTNPANKNQRLFVPASTISISESASSSASGTASAVPSLYVSPSQFRFAMTLQHIKEAQASIDNRYQSYIRKFFGARARDYRLDRPEFLGGSVMELNVSDVTQTSQSTENSVLGEMAGKSVTAGSSRIIRYHADEHCVILGLIHIMPDTEYIGGLSRIDETKDRFDWAMPQFSHLSEQAVYNRELSYNGISTNDEDAVNNAVFGYEPIMNHLRWRPNTACGAFRDTLNSLGSYAEFKPWIQTRDFGARIADNGYINFNTPSLSDEFLSGRYGRDNSNFDITNDEKFYPFKIDSYFEERVVRVISSRGNPSRLG